MDLILERQQLIELARRVPATETRAAIIMLQALIVDPFWLSLQCAPLDDEELTPEAAVSILEAKASIARGEGISREDMLREFGLKP